MAQITPRQRFGALVAGFVLALVGCENNKQNTTGGTRAADSLPAGRGTPSPIGLGAPTTPTSNGNLPPLPLNRPPGSVASLVTNPVPTQDVGADMRIPSTGGVRAPGVGGVSLGGPTSVDTGALPPPVPAVVPGTAPPPPPPVGGSGFGSIAPAPPAGSSGFGAVSPPPGYTPITPVGATSTRDEAERRLRARGITRFRFTTLPTGEVDLYCAIPIDPQYPNSVKAGSVTAKDELAAVAAVLADLDKPK